MTIQQPELMGADEARQVTNGIRLALDRVSTAWADLAERISDAYQRRADLALGYDSWAEYAEAELRPSHELAADIRRELVALLGAQGMSTRAIAPTVGVAQMTVVRDSAQVKHSVSPGQKLAESIEAINAIIHQDDDLIDAETGEVLSVTRQQPPASVTGLDGKTYTRPSPQAPTKPKRRPLPDVAHDAAVALTDAVERVERAMTDDRLPQNREQVARLTRNHLLKAIETLQRLAEELPN